MENLVMILSTVVAVVVIIVLAYILYRKNSPKKQKMAGRENGTNKGVAALKGFARSHDFRFIEPAVLGRGDATAHIDALVIGYFGIIGIKAYGYNGEVYGGANEKEWAQIVEGNRTTFANPITEAAADVRVVRDALLAAKIRQLPVEVLCVFTDASAQLAIPRNTGHYTLKEFKSYLKKEKFLEDKGIDLDAAEAAIKAAIKETV